MKLEGVGGAQQLLESQNGQRGGQGVFLIHGESGMLVCVMLPGTFLRSRRKKG